MMNGGGEELGAGGLGLRQLGFQGVAQRQQLGHLRHDLVFCLKENRFQFGCFAVVCTPKELRLIAQGCEQSELPWENGWNGC